MRALNFARENRQLTTHTNPLEYSKNHQEYTETLHRQISA